MAPFITPVSNGTVVRPPSRGACGVHKPNNKIQMALYFVQTTTTWSQQLARAAITTCGRVPVSSLPGPPSSTAQCHHRRPQSRQPQSRQRLAGWDGYHPCECACGASSAPISTLRTHSPVLYTGTAVRQCGSACAERDVLTGSPSTHILARCRRTAAHLCVYAGGVSCVPCQWICTSSRPTCT